jgi:bacillithiol biosynthesis cysteine-adding enzyme BshC
METTCLRHTNLPNTSRLFSDFLYHYDRVAKYYELPGKIEYPESRREKIVSALREQNGDHPALDTLAKPNAVAYVTGQQVGLFSGPAYTLYKALTAIRLAEQSNAEGIPAVPVFWLATEDHDFAEVNHSWSFNQHNQPVFFRVDSAESESGQQPVGNIAIADWPIAELEASLEGFSFASEVIDLVKQSYRPGATMGQSFQQFLATLLKPYGLLFLDPLHPSIRAIAAPLLTQALEIASDLKQRLLDRNKELEDSGYHAQVHIEAKTSLFFLLENGKRIALRRQEGSYLSSDRRYTPAELAQHAENLSPNAILRPVMQDYLLPTAAYVGGPAEIAYFAQSQVLYEALLGGMPRVVSRAGFTILSGRTTKLMKRYGLEIKDLFPGDQALAEKMAARLIPSALQARFEKAGKSVTGELGKLTSELEAFDPTLKDALEKSRDKMLYQLAKMQSKVAREAMRRTDHASSDASYLMSSLFPHKHLQERLYSVLPFLALHGPGFIEQIYENVRLDCPDHILLSL